MAACLISMLFGYRFSLHRIILSLLRLSAPVNPVQSKGNMRKIPLVVVALCTV